MMTTFRVGAMSSPCLPVGLALWMRRTGPQMPQCYTPQMLYAQDPLELGQVPYLELGSLHPLGQGAPVAVDPGRGHADALGARDVDVRTVADKQRVTGSRAHAL